MTLRNAFGDIALESTQVSVDSELTELVTLLGQLITRTGYFDPTTGGQRVSVVNTPSIGTVTTVSTVTNTSNVGGYAANYDQYSAMLQMVAPLRAGVSVS